MPRHKALPDPPTWTPNQVVAGNLNRLRTRRGLTQAETALKLSLVAGKEWTEAMVAHAERSVTGNRVREFTADDLVTFARAFDVPVLYFLTPPPAGLWVHVPGSRIDTLGMLEAVLGRPDNLSEWETILDEWYFTRDEELPYPLSQAKRDNIRAVAGEVALISAHHLIRKHFKGDLDQLRETLGSLANLVLDVQQHEALASLDEDEHMRRLEAMRANVAKGNRLADANDQFFKESVAAHKAAQKKPAKKKDQRP
ncbi:MAG TPA: helix-turn-helix transcriptional regulator [Acidimicrobiales bacterium]|nr:helix-turn-helix transcriptional regulator [Acidimicrobiales bacterium]